MADTLPTVDPKVQAVLSDAAATEALAVAMVKAFKTSGVGGIVAQAPAAIPVIQQDIADVEAAIPAVKAGFKTSEFWVATLSAAALVVIPKITGQPVSPVVGSVIGAIATVYMVVRGMIKTQTPAPAPVTPAVVKK